MFWKQMKYFDLKNQLNPLVTFSLQDIFLIDPEFRQATLYDWEKAGKVVKLRNNCYIFGDFTPQDLDFYLISNQLYQPSYISMELALNHYGIIPEAVSVITAVSSNKTNTFTTPIGVFQYQSLRPELFFGYDLFEHRNYGIQIASLEKTLLDYLYLNPDVRSPQDFEGLRWNKYQLSQQLDHSKLMKYLIIYQNKSLEERISSLKEYLKGKNA